MLKKENMNKIEILDDDFVHVIPTINNVDIQYTKHPKNSILQREEQLTGSSTEKVKKIDKKNYFDPNTNDVKEYIQNTERI